MKNILAHLKTNKIVTKLSILILVFALIGGCAYGINSWNNSSKPELTSYVDVDPEGTITVGEDEVPLGNTKVTTKKKTKTTKKKVKLKKAAKKTKTVKKPKKTKTTKKTTKSSKQVVTVQTTKETVVTEKYTKSEKEKVVTTKVTTTIQTTTTDMNGTSTVQVSSTNGTYDVDIQTAAPKADERVLNAYNTLGFTVTVNSGVSYSGYFNARNQQIILKKQDDTIYHELGHFLAFLAGNVDKSSEFTDVYNSEKNNYTGTNKAYVTQSSAEYYAESFRDYSLNPTGLKNSRPETYEIIEKSLNKLTDSYVGRIKVMYGPVWK